MSDDKAASDNGVDEKVTRRELMSPLASAHAPMIVFDEAAFFGIISRGLGEIALAANRYCDARGTQVVTERFLTASIRGSLPAIRTLKYAVDQVHEMLEAERARELAEERALAAFREANDAERERERAGDEAMAILRDAAEPEFRN